MSDTFNVYEDNLLKCLGKIQNASDEISASLNTSTTSVNSEAFDTAFKFIVDGEKIVKQMNIELSSLNKNIATDYKSKINEYSNLLSSHKKDLKKYKEKASNEKNVHLFDYKQNEDGLIPMEEFGYSGSQKLQEAKRVLAGTEDTANKIMVDMDDQTNKMKSVSVKIQGMNDNLDDSNSLLTSMQNIIKKNKRIFIGFGIAFGFVIILTLTLKLIFSRK